ncbi:MAG: phosphatase PAP2 family protein [Candidatus Eisenbacteria bacterium]|nr:phosphatase PAP2 family protein [Candidatus Eisenbacteria bacterium]
MIGRFAGGRRRRPAERGNLWRLVVLLLVVLYFVQIDNLMKVRPDHAFLSLLIVALVLGNARRFLIDWSPFIALWIAYDSMRGIADDLAGKIHIVAPFRLEQALFGWLGGGTIPNFAMLEWRQRIDGTALRHFLDAMASGFYAMHMAAPLVLAWIFWHTLRDRRAYFLFILAFSIVTWASFATYFAYPAAPPWYVRDFGFVQPEANFKGAGAGNLVATDRWIGIPLFESMYRHLNPNKFAAIPSLHSAFPLLIFLHAMRRFGRRALPVALFPLGVWFSAVYLNHHYLIDILLAIAYVLAADLLVRRVLFPRLFERGPLRAWLEAGPRAGPAALLASEAGGERTAANGVEAGAR